MDDKEKRLDDRVIAFWTVEALQKSNIKCIGKCKNVSANGFLLTFKNNFKVGQSIKVFVKAAVQNESQLLEFVVKISHITLQPASNDYCVGVEIISDCNCAKPFLEKYIKYKNQQIDRFKMHYMNQ